ncbi:hypothetical protein JL720_893 [Aureococcus anophagefferens]|nr:hypothetical protein JL720_893 [Aureococcus anophagefferens]
MPAATAAAYEFPAPFDADDELAATDALLPPDAEWTAPFANFSSEVGRGSFAVGAAEEETPFARENSGSDGEGKSDDTFESSVDVAVDAFDFAGGELPSAGEPFVAVQQ